MILHHTDWARMLECERGSKKKKKGLSQTGHILDTLEEIIERNDWYSSLLLVLFMRVMQGRVVTLFYFFCVQWNLLLRSQYVPCD